VGSGSWRCQWKGSVKVGDSVRPKDHGSEQRRRDAPGACQGSINKEGAPGPAVYRGGAAQVQASSPETRNPPFSGGSTLSASLLDGPSGPSSNRIHHRDNFIASVIHLARNRQVGGASTPSYASKNDDLMQVQRQVLGGWPAATQRSKALRSRPGACRPTWRPLGSSRLEFAAALAFDEAQCLPDPRTQDDCH
jgi:hypothetical protein